MAKQDVVLVILKKESLADAVKNLNSDKVNLQAIITDSDDEKFFPFGADKVPLYSILNLKRLIKKHKGAYFLISSYENNIGDVSRMQRFLTANGVAKERVVNFELSTQISRTWLANLRNVEKYGADFFATGDEFMRDGLNVNFIPRVHVEEKNNRGGAILADEHQDLRQSYLIAKHVFEHSEAGAIKFVLIGLMPNAFHFDSSKDFSNSAKNFQYTLAFKSKDETEHDRLLNNFLSDDFKKSLTFTAGQTDLNFNSAKTNLKLKLSGAEIMDWVDDSQALKVPPDEKNIKILKDYIKLCLDNGAKPVGVVFPVAEIVRKTYNKKALKFFRDTIDRLKKEYDFTCIDWFDHLGYDCFYDLIHLNMNGSWLTNAVIAMKLEMAKIIPTENFLDTSYEYLRKLSWTANRNDYHAFMKRIFAESVKRIRRKDKIKVGFVMIDSAQWSGDDLYNLFANDDRFEVTVYACLRADEAENELMIKDFWHGVEQFKERGLNVVAIDKKEDIIPVHDVLFSLTPYFYMLPDVLSSEVLTPKTLITHMPYGIGLALRGPVYYGYLIFRVVWKMFFTSTLELEIYEKEVKIGMPRGFYSGYTRTDAFFKKDLKLQFDWKMARPDAKKIIYAPHWSINEVNKQATFQWNYQFMYEFARDHQEISWVIKPHQALYFSAVKEGVFSSPEEYEAYLQKWDALPNALLYTGAYYQAIFATSDGMIHDSGSFIAEYQYVQKPMIFMTRDTEKFNEIGDAILEASYTVDGQDLEGIAAMIQTIFIEGNDYKAAERREVFDKYLNYAKTNGMLASEFIFKSIADEFNKD